MKPVTLTHPGPTSAPYQHPALHGCALTEPHDITLCGLFRHMLNEIDEPKPVSAIFRNGPPEARKRSFARLLARNGTSLVVPQRPRKISDVLYAIRNTATGAIKIGISGNPEKRISDLQRPMTDRLELLGSMPGTFEEERALHRRFADAGLGGEWFRPTKEVMEWVASMAGSAANA